MADVLGVAAIIIALVAVLPVIWAIFERKRYAERLRAVEKDNETMKMRVLSVDKAVEAVTAMNSVVSSRWVILENYRNTGAWPEDIINNVLQDGEETLARILNEALLWSQDEKKRRSAIQQLGMRIGNGRSLMMMKDLSNRLDDKENDKKLVEECCDALANRLHKH